MKLSNRLIPCLAIFMIFVVPLPLLIRETAWLIERNDIPGAIVYGLSFFSNLIMVAYLVFGVLVLDDD